MVDESDGAVTSVVHPVRGRSVLLHDAPDSLDGRFHQPERRWGKGFLITDRGGFRWDQPESVAWRDDGLDLIYVLGEVQLSVQRTFGDAWTETYTLVNGGSRPTKLGTVAVSTPWRDVYHSSADCLNGAVHAHVWTGGSDSWVWATPMDGSGPGLGLALTTGHLWSYSVESRDQITGSNIRGHIYLQVNDAARSPDAMGGQPQIELLPGERYSFSWNLRWWDDLPAFHASMKPLLRPGTVAAAVGESITITAAPGAVVVGEALDLRRESEQVVISSTTSGIRHLYVKGGDRRSRISVLFHRPLRDIAEGRVRFILDHQRGRDRGGAWADAFLPFDQRWGLTVSERNWNDWSDTRERVAMALLLQEVRRRGWGRPDELDEILDRHLNFVRTRVVDPDGTVHDDSRHHGPLRLYNFGWYALLFLNQHRLTGSDDDLALAVSIVDRYYVLGGERFLAFALGPILRHLAHELGLLGDDIAASRMHDHLLRHARTFVELGDELPRHEVNYEQSMVAPLLDLMLNAYQVDPTVVPAEELHRRLGWLSSFAADQPDVRMRHVPIRHWDGYWFGALRMWGDVYPHYWSVLSASVLASWPPELATSEGDHGRRRDAAQAIMRSNLTSFTDNGGATCAFVYPSCVNGNPAHVADPLANDQDWALVYALSDILGAGDLI